MKKQIFLACAALVVSAAAVVGIKAYNYYSMPELMRANLEALSSNEININNATLKIRCVTTKADNSCHFVCSCGHYFEPDEPYYRWRITNVYGECPFCHKLHNIKF